MNLDLRNGLYALFRQSVDEASPAAFRWIGVFSEQCRDRGGIKVPLDALADAGRKNGLEEPVLRSLCSGPLLTLQSEIVYFKFSAPELSYLSDRLPRFLQVLSAHRSAESELDQIRLGQELFNAGLFYESHEYLEELWRKSEGRQKRLVQGLIQAGAGFHKFELGSPLGAAGILRQAVEKLCEDSPLPGLDPIPFADLIDSSRKDLESGTFRLEQAPKMSVLAD